MRGLSAVLFAVCLGVAVTNYFLGDAAEAAFFVALGIVNQLAVFHSKEGS